jgi:hypothetical protein
LPDLGLLAAERHALAGGAADVGVGGSAGRWGPSRGYAQT